MRISKHRKQEGERLPIRGLLSAARADTGEPGATVPDALLQRGELEILRVASANVCTLGAADQRAAERAGLGISGRATILQAQFCERDYHIIGIQESRLPAAEPRKGAHYYIFSSGATKQGSLGVQCWIAPVLVAGVRDVRPISQRLLGLAIAFGQVRLVVIICHAPHNDDLAGRSG